MSEKNTQTLFAQALSQIERKQLHEARRLLESAIQLNRNDARVHAVLGVVLDQLNDPLGAIASFQTSLKLNPNDSSAHLHLAGLYQKLHQYSEAQSAASRSLSLNPKSAHAHAQLGLALAAQRRIPDAINCFKRSVALDPNLPDVRLALAFSLLLTGNYTEGFAEHEHRYRSTHDPLRRLNLPGPRWNGSDLSGKTLLVHTEQGLGDAIMFCRYLPLLAERGVKVLLLCPKALHTLFQSLPNVELYQGDQPYHAHTPLLSLPYHFQTALGTIPKGVRYLHAGPMKIEDWRARLGTLPPGWRVGLAWAGSPHHPRNAERSIDPPLLAPLSQCPNIQWISLQKSPASLPPLAIHDFTRELIDLSDTAALIAALDLVITVDTATAHLAGALGKKVWTLVTYVPDWRWLLDREDSPWYPTTKLVRQPALNDWPSVVADVAKALTTFSP